MKHLKNDVIKHRQALHQMPEGGFKEVRTSAYIKKELIKLGYEPLSVAKTGVAVYIEGESKSCIALRADMDGLPIKEETNVPFKSTNGYMHACGHDGHMAILLGFANHLKSIPSLKRSVLLLFQPAEEGPGGAKVLLDEGIFETYQVEEIYGLHIFPGIEQGMIGVRSGVMMAQTGEFIVEIIGKSGHGAMPHTANDALIATTHLIQAYQTIVSRNINAVEGGIVTVGMIKGGQKCNIICESVKLEGTFRALSHETYELIKKRMTEINSGIEVMFKVEIQIQWCDRYPCVVNDSQLLQSLQRNEEMLTVKTLEPLMISEDFSFYQEKIAGVFFMLGSYNREKGYTFPLHSCHFNFDEDVLIDGLSLFDKIFKIKNIYM